jgi:protein gp37
MAENTKIEWAHHTFNPWIGCTKVSPACDHCYAEADFATRRKVVQWGAGQPRKHTAPSTWDMPVRWNAEAERLGVRYRVFCASLADVFDNEVPTQWRIELMSLILATPHLDWLLLTKRIGNAAGMLETAFRAAHAGREGWADNVRPNVWIGASITSQAEANRDIPKLLAVPAAKRFLSMEPLLWPVDLRSLPHGEGEIDCLKPDRWEDEIENWRDTSDTWEEDFEDWYNVTIPGDGLSGPMHAGIDWVIVGGESGRNARPMHPDWVRSLRDQCQAAGVPFLFKQWGEWSPGYAQHGNDLGYEAMVDAQQHEWPEGHCAFRVGKKAAGRLLDGREWNEVPG